MVRLRMTGATNIVRLAVTAVLVLLAPVGSHMSALALSTTVVPLLSAVALWELHALVPHAPASAPRSRTNSRGRPARNVGVGYRDIRRVRSRSVAEAADRGLTSDLP
jgi:hypothetical protein